METPELNKLQAVKDESDAIGQFLEWLFSKGYCIGAPVVGMSPPYYLLVSRPIHDWLAEYFEIDLQKVD